MAKSIQQSRRPTIEGQKVRQLEQAIAEAMTLLNKARNALAGSLREPFFMEETPLEVQDTMEIAVKSLEDALRRLKPDTRRASASRKSRHGSSGRHRLKQELMIERVRQLCVKDTRVQGALMFGSFTTGEGDEFSDIEFALFVSDEHLAALDQRTWVSQIAPVESYFQDEYGHHTAIFDNLVRGEFHFEPASRISLIQSWRGYAWFPSMEATLIVDRTGQMEKLLRPFIGSPPRSRSNAEMRSVTQNFINFVLLGTNVLSRGETARAWALLPSAHANLLKMVRITEGKVAHWPTPSRALEKEISAEAYQRYRSCTSDLDSHALWEAYRRTWEWGCELMRTLSESHKVELPQALIAGITERLLKNC